MKRTLFVIALIISLLPVFSQTNQLDSILLSSKNPVPELPPFSVVFDSIMSKSPQRIKLQQLRLESMYNMSLIKRDWLNYISLNTSYYYGKGGVLGTTQTQTGIVSTMSDQATSTYGAGVGLGFTLGSVLNYKTKIKIARSKVDQVDTDLKIYEQELQMRLFGQYAQLQADLEAFNANSILMEMSASQVEIKENQFRLGRADLQQVINVRQNHIQVVNTYESLKKSCKIAIYYFEQLSGIDFNQQYQKKK